MLESTKQRIKEIWLTPALGPSEVIQGLTALGYGLGLVLPPAEWERFYGLTLSERRWGIWVICVGVLRIVIVCADWLIGRVAMTMLSIGLWIYLWASFLTARTYPPRIMILSAWIICEAWMLFRISRE